MNRNASALFGQPFRYGLHFAALLLVMLVQAVPALAAPFAAYVIDARTGQVLYETNSDTRLHPASLTKMMTLYIAFQAIERGEISLDSMVTVSKHAASEPPSKLGLRPGQKIALRYLIRAAAVKSANDAATAIGEAIEGNEDAFARRMTATAKAIGMSRTTFKNANGLTREGHLSTAHDMTMLGRHLFYDFPQYYNIFSRRTADAGVKSVSSTNRRFLDAYEGADGIKTGYTTPAGFNLTASAQRGNKRIIATVLGGRSTAQRNSKMAELLDIGFGKAPNKATVQKPQAPDYVASADIDGTDRVDGTSGTRATAKTIRVAGAVNQSLTPRARPGATPAAPSDDVLLAMKDGINSVLAEVKDAGPSFEQTTEPQPESLALAAADAAVDTTAEAGTEAAADPAVIPVATIAPTIRPAPRPDTLVAAAAPAVDADAVAAAVALATADVEPKAETDEATVLAAADAPVSQETDMAAPAETVLAAAQVQPAVAFVAAGGAPKPRPDQIILASAEPQADLTPVAPEIVTRVSTSGGRQWGINVGNFPSRYHAERMLLQTALVEMSTLDEALRKVVNRKGGFDANFVGLSQETAAMACLRLQARNTNCTVIGPQG
jgi:D-alanyl-D-alanine carboxypeptidase